MLLSTCHDLQAALGAADVADADGDSGSEANLSDASDMP